MAELLRKTGRRGDVLARYGGEEFVALLYGATALRRLALRRGLPAGGERRRASRGKRASPLGRISVSGGVATFPLDAQDDIALIKAADARLYRAKEKGRNCTVGPGPGPEPK